jgi:hypothetical protein
VRNWHPLSKLAIGLGLLGLGVVWWTDQGGTGEVSAVAGRVAQAEGVASPSPAPAPTGGDLAAPSTASPEEPLVGRVLPPAATLEAMVARPLFAPDRRPHDPEIQLSALPLEEWAPEPEGGPAHPAVRFIGSIEEEARLRALVSDGFNVRAIAEGEEIDGWVVVGIEARRLTLGLDEQRLELTIFE